MHMSNKIRVAILYGGRSAEHEISLQSARNVAEAMDKKKYEIILIGIGRDGTWYLDHKKALLQPIVNVQQSEEKRLRLNPGAANNSLIESIEDKSIGTLDVVFPILHGPFGEDGTVQGLLKLANIPFVGADVLGSAVGMDKDVMKRLLRDAGLPVARFKTVYQGQKPQINYHDLAQELGMPCFIKPANLGSSVGIEKVSTEKAFNKAIDNAFAYDRKIIIEESINGREIECAVLGNEDPIASIPGEIIPQHEFYSYEAKYLDAHGASLEIPAKLTAETVRKIQEIAVAAYKVLCCEGMARVDMFLTPANKIYVNEINTIPGFTKISMYPKLWEASGISYSQLIDRLIELAIDRHEKLNKLKSTFV
jgi:D-alanine-D-alanine ligase